MTGLRLNLFSKPREHLRGYEPNRDFNSLETAAIVSVAELATTRRESTDSHFVCGLAISTLTGEVAERQVRVNRDGFELLANLDLEWRLLNWAADVDRHPHGPLSADLTDDQKRTQLANERESIYAAIYAAGLPDPLLLYPTTNGWRVVWRLAQPIPILDASDFDAFQEHSAGLIELLQANGLGAGQPLQVDPTCKEPNRMFRGPLVTRDGKPTWDADYMTLSQGTELCLDSKPLDLLAIKSTPKVGSQRKAGKSSERAMPLDEALAFLEQAKPELKADIVGKLRNTWRNSLEAIVALADGRQQAMQFALKDGWRLVNIGALTEDEMRAEVIEAAERAVARRKGEMTVAYVEAEIDKQVQADAPNVVEEANYIAKRDSFGTKLFGRQSTNEPAPECPPRPQDVGHLRASPNGRGHSELSKAVKGRVKDPAVVDAVWGLGRSKPESRMQDVAVVTRAAKKVRGASPELVFAIVDRDPATGADPETWPTIWATWHKTPAKSVISDHGDRGPVVRIEKETRDTLKNLVDQMVAANAIRPQFFTGIGGKLVQVGGTNDNPEILEVGSAQAFAFLAQNFRFVIETEDGVEFVDPPQNLVKALAGSVNFGNGQLPVLEAISRVSKIDLETGQINHEGYANGTLVTPDPELSVSVADRPTAADVADAVNYLRRNFSEFPWKADSDFTAFGALVLTCVSATSWGSEPTPFFYVFGNRPGIGKTIIAAAACAAANMAFVARPITSGVEGELDKNATAALMAGKPVVVWDNLPTDKKIDSPVIASAVTAAPYCEVRPLGTSENRKVRGNGAKIGTGNNNTFTPEITRRITPIRLESSETKPERRKFKIESFSTHIWKDRSRLISAGLTILRAWILNGRKEYPEVTRFGSFDYWTKVVGNALHEAGLRDFLRNQDELADDASEDDANRIAVLTVLRHRGTHVFTVRQVLPLLKDTCAFLARPGQQVDAQLIGTYLRAIKNVWTDVKGGKAMVARCGITDGSAVWQLSFEATNSN